MAPLDPSVSVLGREAPLLEELLAQRARPRPRLAQEPGPVGERARRHGAGRRGRIVSAGDADDAVLEQRLGDEALVGGRLAGDGHVGEVTRHALEHVLAVAHIQRELDVRVTQGELPHQRGDE